MTNAFIYIFPQGRADSYTGWERKILMRSLGGWGGGGGGEVGGPSSLCDEERDRAPVDTVPSSLEQGKDAVLQSRNWFKMSPCSKTLHCVTLLRW